MTYLLSFLTSDLSTKEPTQFFCHYINHSKEIEAVRSMYGNKCRFEQIIFPNESLVFVVSLESYLEVYSLLFDNISIRKIDCKSLQIHESTSQDLDFFKSDEVMAYQMRN